MIHFIDAVFIVISLVFTSTAASAETTLERIKRAGEIRIGFANEAPFGYQTPDGKLTGEAPEVGKAVLKQLGITKVEGVLTEFGALIPGLRAGHFDMIAAGMYITPQRCKQVQFSQCHQIRRRKSIH
jgi:polar amino acid transport system substrate-binding protein